MIADETIRPPATSAVVLPPPRVRPTDGSAIPGASSSDPEYFGDAQPSGDVYHLGTSIPGRLAAVVPNDPGGPAPFSIALLLATSSQAERAAAAVALAGRGPVPGAVFVARRGPSATRITLHWDGMDANGRLVPLGTSMIGVVRIAGQVSFGPRFVR